MKQCETKICINNVQMRNLCLPIRLKMTNLRFALFLVTAAIPKLFFFRILSFSVAAAIFNFAFFKNSKTILIWKNLYKSLYKN